MGRQSNRSPGGRHRGPSSMPADIAVKRKISEARRRFFLISVSRRGVAIALAIEKRAARGRSKRTIRLPWRPRDFGNRSVARRSPGAKSTRMDAQRRQIGPENAKTAHCARVSVGVHSVFGRMPVVYRWGTGGVQRGQENDDSRVSVRYTLGPTMSGPRLTAKVPERACCGVLWHTCIIDAWGVEPKAGPAGRIGDSRCMKDRKIDAGEADGSEPPRRLSGRRCGAHCARQ